MPNTEHFINSLELFHFELLPTISSDRFVNCISKSMLCFDDSMKLI